MHKTIRLSALAALIAVGFSAGTSGSAPFYGSYGYNDGSSSTSNECISSSDRRWNLNVVGLTSDQRLVCFNERGPDRATNIGFVAGLSGGDTALIGIDYRVQNGMLYGVGNAGGVYLLDVTNASATLVNRLSVALRNVSMTLRHRVA